MYCYLLASSLLVDKGEEEREGRERERERKMVYVAYWLAWLAVGSVGCWTLNALTLLTARSLASDGL